MDDYTKIEKIGEGKYGELFEPYNTPRFTSCHRSSARSIRGTTEIQLTGKISLWLTAVIISKYKSSRLPFF